MTFSELFGTELPIIQAPMAGVQGEALAIAVSNAGGLGSLPTALLAPDALRAELKSITSKTSEPYNVNFFSHAMPAPDPEAEARWREVLKPYYEEFGVDPDSVDPGRPRSPFDGPAAEVLAEFEPPVVSFHYGLPSEELLGLVKNWRPTIISTATTVEEALWLEARGVDAIIAQGAEAGGHRGMFLTTDVNTQVGTFALIPRVVAAVSVPVIAAGGVASPAAVRAALELGAVGVQVGTTYLLTPEATTKQLHREALKSDAAQHTVMTNVYSGRPARGIVNRLIRELGPLSEYAPAFPHASKSIAALRMTAEAMGRDDFTHMWAGQNTTGCAEVPAAEITARLAAEL